MSKTADGSVTVQHIEAAFAGESMTHIKYLYFARVCRAHGDEDSARIFEDTAAQEVQHAFGHMDLLYPREVLDPVKCLDLAVAGETYEYTKMYPRFRHLAEQEGNQAVVREFAEQITESREHADSFQVMLIKAAKGFAALTQVEECHARRYQQALQHARA